MSPLEFHNMAEEPPNSKLKLAIVGHEKNGKSWLAATGRKNVLFHGFDQRSESIAGKKGVYELSYVDPQWPKQPESAQNFLTTLGKLEESLDLHDLGFKVPKGTLVRTNVVDSIQTFARAFQNYALYNSKDIRRELTIGSMKVFLPGGWDAWNAEMVPVENAILRLLALPTDTIIVLHETAEETADSTSEKPRFSGRVGVFPVRYQRLIKYFNEVWRVKLTQTTVNNKSLYIPKVFPLPNYEFDCSTAMLLDGQEDANIEAMMAKHEQRLKALPTNDLQGAKPEAKQLKL